MGPSGSVFEGKTLDDAVRKGLEALGLSRAEVMITMLEEGSSGFLGLGARAYKVRIMPRPGGPPPEPGERGDREGRGRRDRGRDRGRGPRGARDERRGVAVAGADRPKRRDDPRGPEPAREDRPRRRDEGRDERRPGSPRAVTPPAARDESRSPQAAGARPELVPGAGEPRGEERDDEGRRRRRGRRGGRGRGRDEGAPREPHSRPGQTGAAVAEAEEHLPEMREMDEMPESREAYRPPERAPREGREPREMHEREPREPRTDASDAPPMAPAALEAEAKRWTEQLLTAMGFEATVTATADADRVDVTAQVSQDEELLAGRKGEVRQALQHLLNLMINRGDGARYHLQLEINEFWKRREEELHELAHTLAEEAIENQAEAVSEYLNAQERRVLHVALRDDTRVKTYALGTGMIKRLAVAPAGFPEGPREDE